MHYLSTRDVLSGGKWSVGEAVRAGLAPDGGLFVPETLPEFSVEDFDGAEPLHEVAKRLIAPFFEGDELAPDLGIICTEALNFPTPIVDLADGEAYLGVLELFRGPTAAFKDVGARFLAGCMQRLPRAGRSTILVATSGDTGGAVAAAFHGRPGTDVVVLYPDGLVSPRQAHQLSCWGDNVRTFAVQGDFDACQRMVKESFQDEDLKTRLGLTSANSINIGRLLPQAAYYAWSSLTHWRRRAVRPGFVVPTGNLGNALACLWARAMGLPIGDVVLATNANRPIPDYLDTGGWSPRATVATLASAMDVGNPSNMERVFHRWPDHASVRGQVRAVAVLDDDIRQAIRRGPDRYGQTWCPHTATAVHAWEQLPEDERSGDWILVGTAHPAKFETVVEPLVGHAVAVPEPLAKLLDQPAFAARLAPDTAALKAAIAPGAAATSKDTEDHPA